MEIYLTQRVMIIRNLFIILLSFIVFNKVIGQNISKVGTFVDCLNNYFGADDLLINGKQYVPGDPNIKGDPFCFNKEYSEGTIFIKDNAYLGLKLNYDVYFNYLIVLNNSKGLNLAIVANHELVDSFYILNPLRKGDNHLFVNESLVSAIDKDTEYLEQLYKGKVSFYMAYKKRFFSNYSDLMPKGMYSNIMKKLYVLDTGTLKELKNRRAFLKYFKKYKFKLKEFMKDNNIKFKKASTSQYFMLFDYLNDLLSIDK